MNSSPQRANQQLKPKAGQTRNNSRVFSKSGLKDKTKTIRVKIKNRIRMSLPVCPGLGVGVLWSGAEGVITPAAGGPTGVSRWFVQRPGLGAPGCSTAGCRPAVTAGRQEPTGGRDTGLQAAAGQRGPSGV